MNLGEVETAIRDSIRQQDQEDEIELIAVNVPDHKKGEKLVVLCEEELAINELKKLMLARGCNPFLILAKLMHVDKFPILGSSKTDFAKVKAIALAED